MSNKNKHFTEPTGWQWGNITPRTGQHLRYGWATPPNAKALCVIYPGLSEYGEKYFEVVNELIAKGFAVAVIDWRGQGLSWRHLPDHDKRHNDDFALDTDDGVAFLDALNKIPELVKLPKVLLGHSMGSHIGLRVMERLKTAFTCAVLSAPMFAINIPTYTQTGARLITEKICNRGWGENYLFGYAPWTMAAFMANLNFLTTDPDRRAHQIKLMTEKPSLRMGGLTFGWLKSALDTTKLTQNPAWLSGITTPTLIALPSRETIVSNAATIKGAASMPHAQILEIEGCLHEILMEKDEHRAKFWAGFDAFVAKHLAPS